LVKGMYDLTQNTERLVNGGRFRHTGRVVAGLLITVRKWHKARREFVYLVILGARQVDKVDFPGEGGVIRVVDHRSLDSEDRV
jgi:hypothetical protein